jgi:hypothetical protein
MKEAIQLKISLENISPEIWREILVPKNYTFYQLHYAIQIAMGWTNSHLNEFIVKGYKIGILYDGMEEYDDELLDSKEIKIMSIIFEPGESFIYHYDFGDGWKHIVTIEKFVMLEDAEQLPFCIAGELKCPPEDCGGIPGFYNFLSIVSDKSHPEYKETKYWVGGKYNRNEFNQDKVNKKLRNIKRYIRLTED